MAVTTIQQEYKRLRSYLNPYIKGPNTDAVLNALATGNSSYLINNAAAVNDNLYIVTAQGPYLDQRLADFGIVRPPAVGLSDEIFAQIGIQVKNRKQVRDLINNLLDSIFGDEYVRATNKAAQIEPYALADGDNLIINFDESHTVNIKFSTNQFENIAAATAQEVADAIVENIRQLGLTGTAIIKNDGTGNYVELISDTIGPVSSVTVLGGSAQNQLLFPEPVPAGGNASTQWTLSLQPGGKIRFTWTGGANPNLGKVAAGDYVNVFGGGFTSSTNEGSYTILDAVGGAVNLSYFEVENVLGTSGVITQGAADAVLFFNPVRKTLASSKFYAAVYQTSSRMLQIFVPATTQVVRRSREGAAYLHYPPNEVYTFNSNANTNDQFHITTVHTLVAGTDFVIGATALDTLINLAAAVNTITGLDATVGTNTLTVVNDLPSITLLGTYTGVANITTTGAQGDPTSVIPNQPGPYSYDLTQPFTITSVSTPLTENLNGADTGIITVGDSTGFPDDQGYIMFGYGTAEQEGPVPYVGRPSSDTLLISPIYTTKMAHAIGTTVSLINPKTPVTVTPNGTDYPFYITDIVSGRVYAEQLIESIAATGIKIVFTILYPDDIGLGKWGTPYSEISTVYGP